MIKNLIPSFLRYKDYKDDNVMFFARVFFSRKTAWKNLQTFESRKAPNILLLIVIILFLLPHPSKQCLRQSIMTWTDSRYWTVDLVGWAIFMFFFWVEWVHPFRVVLLSVSLPWPVFISSQFNLLMHFKIKYYKELNNGKGGFIKNKK